MATVLPGSKVSGAWILEQSMIYFLALSSKFVDINDRNCSRGWFGISMAPDATVPLDSTQNDQWRL